MKKILNIDLDVLGVSASVLCAIHCALVPLIITFGLLGGVSFLADPLWDFLFIGLSLILAFSSLINGYKNHHQNPGPLLIAFTGFSALALGHILLHGMLVGDILSVSGGVLIAVAHYRNYKACRTCQKCRD